jgi:hypothetical protein
MLSNRRFRRPPIIVRAMRKMRAKVASMRLARKPAPVLAAAGKPLPHKAEAMPDLRDMRRDCNISANTFSAVKSASEKQACQAPPHLAVFPVAVIGLVVGRCLVGMARDA